ncbi:MAG TPA: hypothetical protein VHK69_16375, partial [Chitinophagaceae bacterium]|jgi:multidrug efflux pump subunit AcrA (membrane-fusion protein)|nr:hypothetical protein [Chitinophagaceae bacterium]
VIFPARTVNGWTVPYDALLDGDAGTAYLFVTDDGRTAQKVQVQVSSIQKDKVVLSGGLDGHKAVIVSGSAYLKEGSRVRILP